MAAMQRELCWKHLNLLTNKIIPPSNCSDAASLTSSTCGLRKQSEFFNSTDWHRMRGPNIDMEMIYGQSCLLFMLPANGSEKSDTMYLNRRDCVIDQRGQLHICMAIQKPSSHSVSDSDGKNARLAQKKSVL